MWMRSNWMVFVPKIVGYIQFPCVPEIREYTSLPWIAHRIHGAHRNQTHTDANEKDQRNSASTEIMLLVRFRRMLCQSHVYDRIKIRTRAFNITQHSGRKSGRASEWLAEVTGWSEWVYTYNRHILLLARIIRLNVVCLCCRNMLKEHSRYVHFVWSNGYFDYYIFTQMISVCFIHDVFTRTLNEHQFQAITIVFPFRQCNFSATFTADIHCCGWLLTICVLVCWCIEA